MDQFVVSARKYRPQQFDSVVDQGNIVTTLKNAILRRQLAHAYLFCGPRGVGKTTCARIFAKTINCFNPTKEMEACGECESCRSFAEGRSYCIHELDAASNNSVDDIRELIDKVRIPPQIGNYSVYIIDEVHMLSQAAFNAFLKTLEEPPSYALFILATTEKHKVLPTILSRCQVFDFNRISIKAMVPYLASVAEKEEVSVSAEALHIIAQKADGAMRDALTLLDQCIAVCGREVSYAQVISNLNVLDREYYFRLTQMALDGAFDKMLLLFDEILSKGFNALHFIGGLSSHFRDLIVCKQPGSLPLLEYGHDTANRFIDQAALCTLPFLFKALGLCSQAEAGYKTSNNPRLHIELTLIRLSQLRADNSGQPKEQPVPDKPGEQPVAEVPQQPAAPEVSRQKPQQTTPGGIPDKGGSKSVSIKTLIQKNGQADNHTHSTTEPATQVSGDDNQDKEITLEDLEKVMPGLLALFENRPHLATTLTRCPPSIIDGVTVEFRVINELQKKWIEERFGITIDRYLRNALANSKVSVSLAVEETCTEQTPQEKCYMPEEKAKFIAGQHPEIAALKNDLSLDVS